MSEILELRHEASQVAATQCEVCGGSVETPTHVVVLLEDRHIMKRHYIYMTSFRSGVTPLVQNYVKL